MLECPSRRLTVRVAAASVKTAGYTNLCHISPANYRKAYEWTDITPSHMELNGELGIMLEFQLNGRRVPFYCLCVRAPVPLACNLVPHQ